MTTNYRDAGTPMVGSLRDSKPDEYNMSLLWNIFSDEVIDNSVAGFKEVTYTPDIGGISGPHTFNINRMKGYYLDPKSIRVHGKAKILYKAPNETEFKDNLPKFDENTQTKPVPLEGFDYENCKISLKHNQKKLEGGEDNVLVLKKRKIKAGTNIPAQGQTAAVPAEYEYEDVRFDLELEPPKYDDKRAKVGVVNSLNQALFKDVNVIMNNHSVSQNANLEFAHKAYLCQLLSYKKDTQESNLDTEIWDLEKPHDKSEIMTDAWKRRRDRCCTSEEFDFAMQLPTELTNIPSIFIDDMDYQFVFHRNTAEFCLMIDPEHHNNAEGTYAISLQDFKMTVRYMIPAPAVQTWIQNKILNKNSNYDFVRTDVMSRQIGTGVTEFEFSNIFSASTLPDQLFMFLVDSQAKNGLITKNPFYFEHGFMNNVVLQFNGSNIPDQPYTPRFFNKADKQNPVVARELRGLFDNIHLLYANEGLAFNRERFNYGQTIMAWDLNPDLCGGGHRNHKRLEGNLALRIKFDPTKVPREQNLTCCVMGVFRDKLVITQDRLPIIKSTYDEMQLTF